MISRKKKIPNTLDCFFFSFFNAHHRKIDRSGSNQCIFTVYFDINETISNDMCTLGYICIVIAPDCYFEFQILIMLVRIR